MKLNILSLEIDFDIINPGRHYSYVGQLARNNNNKKEEEKKKRYNLIFSIIICKISLSLKLINIWS